MTPVSPSRRRRVARIIAGLAAVLALVACKTDDALAHMRSAGMRYDKPGQLVALPDGRKLNLRCSGRGSPTVILEAGFSGNSEAWVKVQPEIAKKTRVCAYDRAGSG